MLSKKQDFMKNNNFMEKLLDGVSQIEETGLDDEKINYCLNEAKEPLNFIIRPKTKKPGSHRA